MRILFLSDNFPPEVNAPALRTHEHCVEWVAAGHSVTVITTAPNFPGGVVYNGYRNRLYNVEFVDGIRVVRVWSYITANKGFLKRTLDYISFAISGVLAGLVERCDVIVATSPQFFTACAGCALGFLKRRPWVFELRDLWPESIKAVGALSDSAVFRWLERLELFLYRRCAKIIAVTDSFKEILVSRGIAKTKIAVVKNGARLARFAPRPPDTELEQKLNLTGKRVFGYIGTLGMAHGLDFLLRCAPRIKCELPDVHLLLVGDGAERERLLKLADELELDNLTILPAVPHDQIPRYLSILTASLVVLKSSPTFLSVIPSKIFESAAMEIPIVLGVDGEARALVEHYNAGIFFSPESENEFLSSLHRLSAMSPEDLSALRHGGRGLAQDLNRPALARQMLSELLAVATTGSRSDRLSANDNHAAHD